VRDGVDQPIPRQIAFDDEMPQNTGTLGVVTVMLAPWPQLACR
jgi:hypothetical protein